MNATQAADSSIMYAWLIDGAWGIYSNTVAKIRNTRYPNREDISRDYAFFDPTNPSYYLFIQWDSDGYRLFKKWEWVHGKFLDVWLDVKFGYDNKIIMPIQDSSWWRIIEF
jgi:hypothetical protein